MPSRSWIHPTGLFLGLLLSAATVPLATRDPFHLDVAMRILESLVLAMGLRLVLATGRLNLAHSAFMAIGAYVSAALVMHLGLSFWFGLLLASLSAAVLAAVVGLITLRLTGSYFFLVTFALLNVVVLFFQGLFVNTFGGPSGLSGIPKPDPMALFGLVLRFDTKLQLYLLALAALAAFGALFVRLEHSRFGLLCTAIRQAETLAATLGINPLKYKVAAFVIASLVAGAIGSIFAHSQGVVNASDFGTSSMLRLLVFVVVGGIGSMWGAITRDHLDLLARRISAQLRRLRDGLLRCDLDPGLALCTGWPRRGIPPFSTRDPHLRETRDISMSAEPLWQPRQASPSLS